jgi:hypothetical protein
MTRPVPNRKGVLRRDVVQIGSQPALVGCADAGNGPISVVPLMDGDRIAGLEVHCACGARAVVECVYPDQVSSQVDPKQVNPAEKEQKP